MCRQGLSSALPVQPSPLHPPQLIEHRASELIVFWPDNYFLNLHPRAVRRLQLESFLRQNRRSLGCNTPLVDIAVWCSLCHHCVGLLLHRWDPQAVIPAWFRQMGRLELPDCDRCRVPLVESLVDWLLSSPTSQCRESRDLLHGDRVCINNLCMIHYCCRLIHLKYG